MTAVVLAACGDGATVRAVSPGNDEAAHAAPCPPSDAAGDAVIDWVEFVRLDGVMYSGVDPANTVDSALVGEQVARVRCRIGDIVSNPDFRARDGDAAYLPAGTALHAFGDADPDLRLAVEQEGAWRVYEADRRDTARHGSDVLDLGGGVERVELRDGDTGERVLGTVDKPPEVDAIVQAVLSAGTVEPDYDVAESPLFVRFVLTDGTYVERDWLAGQGVLGSVIRAPQELDRLRR
ncbi:MAG: hypothetical protein ACRDV2_06100 [Actinomycetes bacterium]